MLTDVRDGSRCIADFSVVYPERVAWSGAFKILYCNPESSLSDRAET